MRRRGHCAPPWVNTPRIPCASSQLRGPFGRSRRKLRFRRRRSGRFSSLIRTAHVIVATLVINAVDAATGKLGGVSLCVMICQIAGSIRGTGRQCKPDMTAPRYWSSRRSGPRTSPEGDNFDRVDATGGSRHGLPARLSRAGIADRLMVDQGTPTHRQNRQGSRYRI